VDLIPHLTGKTTEPPHRSLFWRFWNQSAVRMGRWKYLRAGDREFLFDLASPEHEKINRIAAHPEIAAILRGSLKAWASPLKNPGISDGPLVGPERACVDHYLPAVR
jgi:hypothetical protein